MVGAPSLEAALRKFDDVYGKGSGGTEGGSRLTILALLYDVHLAIDWWTSGVLMYELLTVDGENFQAGLSRIVDIMALEAEQVQRRNQSGNLSWELDLMVDALMRVADLEENNQTLQATVQTLQEENQQLRKEVEELGTQLNQDKSNSQKEVLEGELQDNIANTVKPYRATQEEPSNLGPENQQGAEERELEELGEQEKQLPEVQEALKQEQAAKALDTEENGENERLRQEIQRLTSWTELLQGEQEELRTQSQELQASLEKEQQKLRIWQAAYRDLKAEQLPKEILLTKLSIQCESLTRAKKDWQEEKHHLRREIDTLKELNQSFLDACDEHWTERSDTQKTMPTGGAKEDRLGKPQEAQCPAPRKKKCWSRARAFLKFFQRQRDGSRGQAKSPPDSLPESLEAMPSCSYWEEEGDTPRGPPPKGHSQVPDDLPGHLLRNTLVS